LADLLRTAYPHEWSPVSCRSGAGQESLPAKDRRSTTEPTPPTSVPSESLFSMTMNGYYTIYRAIHVKSLNVHETGSFTFIFPLNSSHKLQDCNALSQEAICNRQ